MPKNTFGTGTPRLLHFITCILHPMKPSYTYKSYPPLEHFNLESKIAIANGEASYLVKALLDYLRFALIVALNMSLILLKSAVLARNFSNCFPPLIF